MPNTDNIKTQSLSTSCNIGKRLTIPSSCEDLTQSRTNLLDITMLRILLPGASIYSSTHPRVMHAHQTLIECRNFVPIVKGIRVE